MVRNRGDDYLLAVRLGRNLGTSHSGCDQYQRIDEISYFSHLRAPAISVAPAIRVGMMSGAHNYDIALD